MFIPGQPLNADSLNKGAGYAVSKFRTFPRRGAESQSAITIPVVCAVGKLPAYSPVLITPYTEADCGIYGEAHSFAHAQNLFPLTQNGMRAIVGILQESACGHQVVNAVIWGVTRCRAHGNTWDTYGWIPGLPPGEIHSCPGGYLKRMYHSGNVRNDLFLLNPGTHTTFIGRKIADDTLQCYGYTFDNVIFAGNSSSNRLTNRHQLVITSGNTLRPMTETEVTNIVLNIINSVFGGGGTNDPERSENPVALTGYIKT